jgi:hypothetical protein
MGLKALLSLIFLFSLSCLIMFTGVLPSWITANSQLYILTLMLWFIGFTVAFFYAEQI